MKSDNISDSPQQYFQGHYPCPASFFRISMEKPMKTSTLNIQEKKSKRKGRSRSQFAAYLSLANYR